MEFGCDSWDTETEGSQPCCLASSRFGAPPEASALCPANKDPVRTPRRGTGAQSRGVPCVAGKNLHDGLAADPAPESESNVFCQDLRDAVLRRSSQTL